MANPPDDTRARSGYAGLLKSTLIETTRIVRDMHGAIAGQTFGVLERVPLVGAPVRLVAGAHAAIAHGVYTAINGIGGGLLDVVDEVEQRLAGNAHARLPVGIKSALNAAFGDHLHANNSAFAIPMALIGAGAPLSLDRAGLAAAFPAPNAQICVFVHGLGCSDRSWEASGRPDVHLGEELERALGLTPIYLRYNSGLPIAQNGAALAQLLEQLVEAWPAAACELTLIGHSMGGLLARSALEQAPADAPWKAATRGLICIGSPHTGAPLARHGEQLQRALDTFAVTAPLGRLGGARSRGIKDLHDGLSPSEIPGGAHIARRFIGSHLGAQPDGALASLFGDGLVPLASSTTLDGHTPTTHLVLAEIGHLGLLNDPRVLEQIQSWLCEDSEPRNFS